MGGGKEVRSENMKRVAKERVGKKENGGGKGEGQGDIFWTPAISAGPPHAQGTLDVRYKRHSLETLEKSRLFTCYAAK